MNVHAPILLKSTLFLLALASGGLTLVASAGEPASTAVNRPIHFTQPLPAALRTVIFQTFAKDADANSAYRINKDGCTILSGSFLKACFDAYGAHFSSANEKQLILHLVTWGRGAKLNSVDPVSPEFHGSRVSYRRGNLSEWWRVLPTGFEQGFTVMKRPGGQGVLSLTLSAAGKPPSHHDTLAWGDLHYGGLIVTDAGGKVVPATLKSEGDRILIAVNDAHAVYPLTVDPLVWVEQEVTASDGAIGDQFGTSVAFDGTTALIGAPNGNNEQGAVYVFTESGGTWTQTQRLTAGDGTHGDCFGSSVALDGATALIGADSCINDLHGAAYVFTASGGSWSETQKLVANDNKAFGFGFVVALDGATALIGAQYTTGNGDEFNQGAAYVFTASGGGWSETQKLVASDGAAGDFFGRSVALDGTTALIGAPLADFRGKQDRGAVYVFSQSDGEWIQKQKLAGSGGRVESNEFGSSVALNGDTALIGAFNATIDRHWSQGAAYVFAYSGGTWSQTQKLTASDGAKNGQFGSSAALVGNTALIGAAGTTVDHVYQGAAYVFNESDGTWTQTQKLVASDGIKYQYFGSSVALAGTTALIGAPLGPHTGGNAAYFYGESDLGLAVSAPGMVDQGETYVSQTITTNNASAASPAIAVTATVPAAASFVSATATQGSCSEDSGVVSCDFGPIDGNAGTASANVTLKATGSPGTTIENTASVAGATPPLSASAATTITQAGCPAGYTEYNGALAPGRRTWSPPYQAPVGEENAILTAPTGFHLYVLFQNAQERKLFRVPGNEVHRHAPGGTFAWIVKAGSDGGAYTLCVMHP